MDLKLDIKVKWMLMLLSIIINILQYCTHRVRKMRRRQTKPTSRTLLWRLRFIPPATPADAIWPAISLWALTPLTAVQTLWAAAGAALWCIPQEKGILASQLKAENQQQQQKARSLWNHLFHSVDLCFYLCFCSRHLSRRCRHPAHVCLFLSARVGDGTPHWHLQDWRESLSHSYGISCWRVKRKGLLK